MSLSRGVGLYGTEHSSQAQRIAFTGGAVTVAVYGLGKMGLPLAAVYAETGAKVVGADIDEEVVEAVNRGTCPERIVGEPGLPELVDEQVDRGALSATTDPKAAAEEASVHVIIVPTPITGEAGDDADETGGEDSQIEADLGALKAVTSDVASGISPGDVVLVECTVPPGTTEDVVLPIIERESDLSRGEFGLAFCPERTASGQALYKLRRAHPKIVGGVDEESTRVAELIYNEITENDVIPVADAKIAEAVKVFEGLYRDVNIALANELARLADDLGIDVNEAIDAANTQPFCDIHTPGAGVGGHCIPYYPYFLMQQVGEDTPLIRTAREVNDSMPAFTASKLAELLSEEGIEASDATVLVLGVTYRPGVAEVRATPAKPIVEWLEDAGADVLVTDPIVDADQFGGTAVEIEDLPEHDVDGAVLVTAHEEFLDLDWAGIDDMVVVDGRQALDLDGTGHRCYVVGSGETDRSV